MVSYTLIPVPPARKVPSRLLHHGRWQDIDIDEWDKTTGGIKLRAIRFGEGVHAHLSITQLASRLGMKPSELSGLEFGKFTLPPEQWDWLLAKATEVCRHGAR